VTVAFLPGVDMGPNPWHLVSETDPRALALVDGTHRLTEGPHYSRQNPASPTFTGNGASMVMVTGDGMAVWSVIHQRVVASTEWRWRCNVFRRVGGGRASDLIRFATEATRIGLRRRYGALPAVPLTTEVDPKKVRHKRDPGRCFIRAGWRVIGTTKSGLIRLEAPAE